MSVVAHPVQRVPWFYCNVYSVQISKCDVCQRMNWKLTTGTPQLHPDPVKAPWHQLGIDFIGPLSPEADDGSRYILTISDYFTKWVDAIATADKSASTVASSLFRYVHTVTSHTVFICSSVMDVLSLLSTLGMHDTVNFC